jgi:hypothetical protein
MLKINFKKINIYIYIYIYIYILFSFYFGKSFNLKKKLISSFNIKLVLIEPGSTISQVVNLKY